jgi:hypothetical protein
VLDRVPAGPRPRRFQGGALGICCPLGVDLEDGTPVGGQFEAYFGLKEDLEALLGRPVDLVAPAALENPYFAASVTKNGQELYAA